MAEQRLRQSAPKSAAREAKVVDRVFMHDLVLDVAQPIEQIITYPPLAVFEVLSPEDSVQRLKRKLEDYKTMGIPEIWVIDPQDSTFYRYENLQLQRIDSFSYAAKGIAFDMNHLKTLLY